MNSTKKLVRSGNKRRSRKHKKKIRKYSIKLKKGGQTSGQAPSPASNTIGIINTVAQFNGHGRSMVCDSSGNLFILQPNDGKILKMAVGTNVITTFAEGLGLGGLMSTQMAIDSANNLYIAHASQSCIYRVDPTGISTVFAGTRGFSGYDGDSGLATGAKLHFPIGVAVDISNNVFIADRENNCIRRVSSSTGRISTYVNLNKPQTLIFDRNNNLIVRGVSGSPKKVASGTSAITNIDHFPSIIDRNGNKFFLGSELGVRDTVTDAYTLLIRSSNSPMAGITEQGFIIPITAIPIEGYIGDGVHFSDAALYYPGGMAIDASDNIFIADNNYTTNRDFDRQWDICRIRKVNGPIYTPPPLGAPAPSPRHSSSPSPSPSPVPTCLAINTPGYITTVVGDGVSSFTGERIPAIRARINGPQGITFDQSGNMYISDTNNHRIRKVNSSGIITTIAGTGIDDFNGDDIPAISAWIKYPFGIAAVNDKLIFSDCRNHRIREIDLISGSIRTLLVGNLNSPTGLAIDSNGNIFVVDTNLNRILRISAGTTVATNFVGNVDATIEATLNNPLGVAVDGNGNLYIADTMNNRILKVTNGLITTVNTSISMPAGIAVDRNGNIYATDITNHLVRKITGSVVTTVAGTGTESYGGDCGPATNASFSNPDTIAIDPSGNIFVAANNRIRKINSSILSTAPLPASSPRALLAAPNLPRTVNRTDEPAGRYRVNLEISRKDTDYNFLQLGVFNSSGQDISSSMKVNNTNNNRIIPFITTPMRFSIGNLTKTGANYLVLNTINSSSRTPTTLFTEVTGRFAFNLNSLAPAPRPAPRPASPPLAAAIVTLTPNNANHQLKVTWTSPADAFGDATVTVSPPLNIISRDSERLSGRNGQRTYQMFIPQGWTGATPPTPKIYTVTVTIRRSTGESRSSTETYTQPIAKRK